MSDELLSVLHAATDAIIEALSHQEDWSLTGMGNNQYHHDTVADAAAIAVLDAAGLAIFSEESGLHNPDRPVMVVIDPVDGSTNASRGLPWWAGGFCPLAPSGHLGVGVPAPPLGERFEAVRGKGASRNGKTIAPSAAV